MEEAKEEANERVSGTREGEPVLRSGRGGIGNARRRMVELAGVEPACKELVTEISYDSLS